MNAPHKNAEPSATTLTIPLTQPLLYQRDLLKSEKVKKKKEIKNKFQIKNSPLDVNNSLPSITNPSIV